MPSHRHQIGSYRCVVRALFTLTRRNGRDWIRRRHVQRCGRRAGRQRDDVVDELDGGRETRVVVRRDRRSGPMDMIIVNEFEYRCLLAPTRHRARNTFGTRNETRFAFFIRFEIVR